MAARGVLLLAVVVGLAVFPLPAAATEDADNATALTAAAPDAPPYSIVDGEEVAGLLPDLLTAVGEKLGVSVRFQPCQDGECRQMIEAGTVDLSGGLTPLDRESVDWLEPSYAPRSGTAFFVRADSPWRIREYGDLHGLRIAVDAEPARFPRFKADNSLDKRETGGPQESLLLLVRGEVEVVACPEAACGWYVKALRLSGRVRRCVYGHPGEGGLRLGSSRASPRAELAGEFSRALSELRDSGRLEEIRVRWLD
ncbi:substrate-binding periplasmic protein [Desulfohalovibrio reitneri]|uniref:substrate-binding periplasmic protein n=1 Tax=Desulfohalovibrio reitneri TaxID=1307759 RepID=UPI0004A6ADB9|nr:transporter substrate-binding domain-containing protein [Desulfohalovibrio reitneri]